MSTTQIKKNAAPPGTISNAASSLLISHQAITANNVSSELHLPSTTILSYCHPKQFSAAAVQKLLLLQSEHWSLRVSKGSCSCCHVIWHIANQYGIAHPLCSRNFHFFQHCQPHISTSPGGLEVAVCSTDLSTRRGQWAVSDLLARAGLSSLRAAMSLIICTLRSLLSLVELESALSIKPIEPGRGARQRETTSGRKRQIEAEAAREKRETNRLNRQTVLPGRTTEAER